jgi:hypothetical protein
MKRTFKLTLIILVLIGCTSDLEPLPQVTATAQVTESVSVSREPIWNVYDPDPDHIWNRIFLQFYQRTARNGEEYGLGELDPLLWWDTTYLLDGDSHQQAIQVLGEFLSTHAENLIADPLKRAMFQRDLWAVFDWLAFQSEPYPAEREALKTRLLPIIQRIALTKEQIASLPDSYALAIKSGTFPTTFQEDDPDAAFLPFDLFQSDSAWIPMGREGGPIAMAHTEGFPFLGRSVFLVFIRSPNGQKATLDFIHSLNTERRPALTTGSAVALVRRMVLIDDQGDLVLSPLIETVQIRRYNAEQIFYEFELDRTRLLNGYADTLKLKTDLFMLFSSHGDVFAFHDFPLQAVIPDICKACHVNINAVRDRGTVQGILSYSRANFPLPDNGQPILSATTWGDEAKTVINWKMKHHTWQTLKSLWGQ